MKSKELRRSIRTGSIIFDKIFLSTLRKRLRRLRARRTFTFREPGTDFVREGSDRISS